MTETLLPRLGIADAVIPKSIEAGAPAVASGAAEMVIAPVSELIHAPGVHYIGKLPSEIQLVMMCGAAVVAGAKDVDAAHTLIALLSSKEARAATRHSGMKPVN
jgi:molybdate transport system substrate-binding protein